MQDWIFEVGHEPATMTHEPFYTTGVEGLIGSETTDEFSFEDGVEPAPPVDGDLADILALFGSEGGADDEGSTHLGDLPVTVNPIDWGTPPITWGDGSGGGGGGGTPPSDPTDPYDPCEDREADTISDKVNDIIKSKPDSNRVEYGALIWRDAAGNLHHTEVTPGNNGVWIPPSAPTGNGFNSWSQVHSHPTQAYQNGQWVNVQPESHFERPSSGDYVTADFYISQGASAENFTIYVYYSGQVREFDARDNTSESRNTAVTSAGHGTESGDYNPGAACS